MKRLFAACAVSFFLLSACGSDSDSGISTNIRQVNDLCPSTSLKSGGAIGASCSTAADCAEVCCGCSGNQKGYAATACIDGKCATTTDTCAKALERDTLNTCAN